MTSIQSAAPTNPPPAPRPTLLPFNDLRGQYRALRADIEAATARVLESGWYILGAETAAFEAEFAAYCARGSDGYVGCDYVGCVGVNSGTDALTLALRACDVGPGDEVITVAHTAVATVAAIRLTGATPILADIDPRTYTLDTASAARLITPRTRAIVPVHIYGHPAEMEGVLALAKAHNLRVVEDCAQAHGARYRGQTVGTLGDLGCFSFYPTKNLGALGDGGAVISTNPQLVEQVRLLREYGWTPEKRYVSQIEGANSRLDELQAAILRVKLGVLDGWNDRRRALAARYAALLPPELLLPLEKADCRHVYHLYVVRAPRNPGRDALRSRLAEQGVATGIHYPVPVHLQPAYAERFAATPLPVTEQIAHEIFSLPLHPLLTDDDVARVAALLVALLTDAPEARPA